MNWAHQPTERHPVLRLFLIALLGALPVSAHALTQVAGPIQIGPSGAAGDEQNHSATLTTTITNQGETADRLVNVACPGIGTVNLLNGSVEPIEPGSSQQQNGLDLPAAVDGRATPVRAQFRLTNATHPMTTGFLVPCALYFRHAGQRIVIFSLGARETEALEP